jgi:hypothetical protein
MLTALLRALAIPVAIAPASGLRAALAGRPLRRRRGTSVFSARRTGPLLELLHLLLHEPAALCFQSRP